ncbi:MAG TPA: T9SS type A sorting domain-containing protein [Saprospiraceae bacterium]|nr:T9SS type A sorting domain-containing protein [Saprospiraceae bacterium]
MQKLLLTLLACLFGLQSAHAQCAPTILNTQAAIDGCDLTPNDAQFWNEIYWWDPNLQLHDLVEKGVELELTLRDTCPGSIQVRCLLFLDLDGNGTLETVVDSDNLPDPNTVNYNNAFNPNYSGGTARSFDERPVPANQKYRFALQSSATGDSSYFRLVWSPADNPASIVSPELPYGQHKIRWEITYGGGQLLTNEKSFQVKDCKKPTVVCLNGLSVNLMPTQLITLWATDFLQYMEDNATPGNLLKIGIRKSGTGTGFPLDNQGNPITSVTYDCDEQGEQFVEVWSQDVAGNADFCETYVLVQDNLNACDPEPIIPIVCSASACGDVPDEITYNFDFPPTPFLPPFSVFDLGDGNGCSGFDPNLPIPQDIDITISPNKDDNQLEGVSTFDMVILQKHIDGIDLLDNPYQWIAADANKDNVLDTLDILECRKLMLGIYTELPNNTSWRFVDKSYVFPAPDPLSAPIPESVVVNSSNPPSTPLEFVAVKICDLTCGNLVGFYEQTPENQHLIGDAQPNPTQHGSVIPLQLIAQDQVVLDLLDVSGRLLFHQEVNLPQGPAALEIPASAMAQAGMYLWRVRAGDTVKTGKIVAE